MNQIHLKSPDSVLTESGLVLKGVDKIERINCDAHQITAAFHSWQCCRIVRREFYLLSYKMFFVLRDNRTRKMANHLLADLREESEVLCAMTQKYEIPSFKPKAELTLRLVNDEAAILLETMVCVDKALAKLFESEMHEVAEENCIPYFDAYVNLKRFLLHKPK